MEYVFYIGGVVVFFLGLHFWRQDVKRLNHAYMLKREADFLQEFGEEPVGGWKSKQVWRFHCHLPDRAVPTDEIPLFLRRKP
jgi:hypothetical protein